MDYMGNEPKGSMRMDEAPMRGSRPASAEARAVARRVSSALENCLSIPDRPELSYLRCFVRMAFEEASALGATSQPSEDDLAYIDRLQRETRNYRARLRMRQGAKVQTEV